jgi:hypothetical protein
MSAQAPDDRRGGLLDDQHRTIIDGQLPLILVEDEMLVHMPIQFMNCSAYRR